MQILGRTVWRLLEELKTKLSSDLAIPLLGVSREKSNSKEYTHPDVHSSAIYSSQDMEAT